VVLGLNFEKFSLENMAGLIEFWFFLNPNFVRRNFEDLNSENVVAHCSCFEL
jgi:hypothetical protein